MNVTLGFVSLLYKPGAESQNGVSIGPMRCVRQTIRGEGVGGLFKGFSPALTSAMTENAVVWTVNSFLRDMVESHASDGSFEINRKQHAMLGAMTGVVSSCCICPAEVIKVRQQTRTIKQPALVLLKEVIRSKGPRGLFLGVGPLLLRDVPFYFLFFGAMETYFDLVAHGEESLFHSAVGGGLAGSFAWAVVFPLDVIKTRAQVFGTKAGILSTVRTITKNQGVTSLYRGWLPAVLRGFPANGALVFGVQGSRMLLDSTPSNPMNSEVSEKKTAVLS